MMDALGKNRIFPKIFPSVPHTRSRENPFVYRGTQLMKKKIKNDNNNNKTCIFFIGTRFFVTLKCVFDVLTGRGLFVGRIQRVRGKPRAVAGSPRVIRVHGQPDASGRRQLADREVRLVRRQVGQHRRRRPVRGHRGPAVTVVRGLRFPAVTRRRVVNLQDEPLGDAAVEPLRAPHADREQRSLAGSAVERRVWSHCNDSNTNDGPSLVCCPSRLHALENPSKCARNNAPKTIRMCSKNIPSMRLI